MSSAGEVNGRDFAPGRGHQAGDVSQPLAVLEAYHHTFVGQRPEVPLTDEGVRCEALIDRCRIVQARRRVRQTGDVVRLDGVVEPLQLQRAHCFDVYQIGHICESARCEQYLPAESLGTETRGKVHNRPGGAIVGASFEANATQRRIALGNAEADVEVVALEVPLPTQYFRLLTHFDRHAHCCRSVVRAGHGVVEDGHDRISSELLERRLEAEYQLAHGVIELTERAHHVFGLRCCGEGREASEVAADDGDIDRKS